jgi:DNA-binding MarR family transcriptional regulator
MEKERQVLSYLQGRDYTSQRQIARGTGISLTSVNLLLKKMIKKGLVKTQRLNARSLRYILTPRGIAEKSRLTYNFIKRTHSHILQLTEAVERVIANFHKGEEAPLYLYGPRNEVLEILSLVLGRSQIKHIYIPENGTLPDPSAKPVIIVWDHEDDEKLSASYRIVNILIELN